MKEKKYIVTVDLDLPPLQSGVKPYFAFSQFPSPWNVAHKPIIAIQRLGKILKWAKHGQIMVLDSTSGTFHPDLLACIFMRFFNKKPIVVMTGDMWNKSGGLKYHFQKMLVQLADKSIQRYVVQSIGEQQVFSQVWGIAQEKVRLCLYSFTFTDEEINAGEIAAKGYIFSGGNPNRDYNLLLETARRLPNRQFIIAARLLNKRSDLPPNVAILQAPHTEFIRLMREADMVITPIRAGLTRAAGQQTYLNAMRMGKINIVNGQNVFGVTDYIANYVNGIITDGTPQGFCKAIEWVYDPANQTEVKKIENHARESVGEFTYERHVRTMATIIDETISEAGSL